MSALPQVKTKNQQKMLRYAIKHKLDDAVIVGIVYGGATKAMVYGKHPTKKRNSRKKGI